MDSSAGSGAVVRQAPSEQAAPLLHDSPAVLDADHPASAEDPEAVNRGPADELQGFAYSKSELELALDRLARTALFNRRAARLCGITALVLGLLLLSITPNSILGSVFLTLYTGLLLAKLAFQLFVSELPRRRGRGLAHELERSGLAERIFCGAMREDEIFERTPAALRPLLGRRGAGLAQDLSRIGAELPWYRRVAVPHMPSMLMLLVTLGLLLLCPPLLWLQEGNADTWPLFLFFMLLNLTAYLRLRQARQQQLHELLTDRLVFVSALEQRDSAEFEKMLHYHSSSRLPRIAGSVLAGLSAPTDLSGTSIALLYLFCLPVLGQGFDPAALLLLLPYVLIAAGVAAVMHLVLTARSTQKLALLEGQLEQSSLLLDALSERIGGDELREALPPALRWLKSRRKRNASPRRSAVAELAETFKQVAPQLDWYVSGRGMNMKPMHDLLLVLLMLAMLILPPSLAIPELIEVETLGYLLSGTLGFWLYLAWFQVRRSRAYTRLLTEHIRRLVEQ